MVTAIPNVYRRFTERPRPGDRRRGMFGGGAFIVIMTTNQNGTSGKPAAHTASEIQHQHHVCCHNPVHCFLPLDIFDNTAQSDDPDVRRGAIEAIGQSGAFSATRDTLAIIAAIPSPAGTKHCLIYDMKESNNRFSLAGDLVRQEGDGPTDDNAVNEAYDYAGATHDFCTKALDRNSIGGRGMSLISSVHLGKRFNSAFWNGERMTYGNGEGTILVRFTKSLDGAGHEMTDGVVQHTAEVVKSASEEVRINV